METEFLESPIFDKSVVLTSEARSILAVTPEKKVSVSLSCSGVTFFNVELYAYNGTVELLNPGALIEDFFSANDIILESVTVTCDTDSRHIMFLYCENDMPSSFNPDSVLLLSSLARRVHADSKFTVAAIPDSGNTTINFKAVGYDNAGIISTAQFSIRPQNFSSSLHTTFNVSDIVRQADGLKKVIYFSAEYCGKLLMCYVTPAPAYLTFRFRNIFNVPELIDIEGSMVTKSETSRKNAVCAGNIVQYDRRTDRTYQFTSGPLTADETESLAQLLSSHSLELFADGVFHDVVIEDYNYEESTEDNNLTSVKFTWRFKGYRPVNFNSAMSGIRPSSRNIFSEQFSPEYD